MLFLTNKKAEMGISTLIIFIALLLIAVIAAGVLIQTAGSLQEKSRSVNEQSQGNVVTNVHVIQVCAEDGTDGTIDHFGQTIKLSPGSDPIQLDQMLLSMSTYDKDVVLKYRGVNSIKELNYTDGYYTYRDIMVEGTVNSTNNITLTEYDLNHDGQDDHLEIIASTNTLVYVFNDSSPMVGNNRTLGQCNQAGELTGNMGTSLGFIKEIEQTGSICTGEDAMTADEDNTFTIVPINTSTGYYAVEYLQRGNNPVDGNLQQGDVVKICFQSPRGIHDEEEVRFKIIPRVGTPTITEVVTPEVFFEQRAILYP